MTVPETPQPAARCCVTGVDPDERFDIPFVIDEFQLAPQLAAIGNALIADCEEFERLRWAMASEGLTILYLWRKKAAKSADRYKTGTLGKTSGVTKFLAKSQYVVQIACDANRGATNLHMEALVFHELRHIKIETKLVGKGEEAEAVPDLKVRAHDLEMFDAEVARYGLWRADLERAKRTFEQAPLFEHAPAKRSKAAGRDGVSATLTASGRTVDFDDDAAAEDLIRGVVARAARRTVEPAVEQP